MHQTYLEQAIKLAVDNVNSGEGGPYGAVIVKENQVISASRNQVTRSNDPTAHAEVVAIRAACQVLNNFQLTGCSLYSSCEPCPMCLGAIYWARLDSVYYACNRFDAASANFDDSFIYDEIILPPQQRRIKMYHVNLPTAGDPFELWKAKENKLTY